jgi:hypothetical protein
MRQKQFTVLVIFFLVLLFAVEIEAANLFFNPLGPDAETSASGFALSYGPTEYSSTFEGEINNFPIGEQGIVGAFIFSGGKEICIGLAAVDASKKYKMQIFGDNPMTQEVEGAKDGNVIIFKAIINGKLTPLVSISGTTLPIWKEKQIVSNVNLNIEKAGIESILGDILAGGLGVVGGGGIPELATLDESDSSGGFGVPIEETPDIPQEDDIPPVVPEPLTIFMVLIGLGLKLTQHTIKNNLS